MGGSSSKGYHQDVLFCPVYGRHTEQFLETLLSPSASPFFDNIFGSISFTPFQLPLSKTVTNDQLLTTFPPNTFPRRYSTTVQRVDTLHMGELLVASLPPDQNLISLLSQQDDFYHALDRSNLNSGGYNGDPPFHLTIPEPYKYNTPESHYNALSYYSPPSSSFIDNQFASRSLNLPKITDSLDHNTILKNILPLDLPQSKIGTRFSHLEFQKIINFTPLFHSTLIPYPYTYHNTIVEPFGYIILMFDIQDEDDRRQFSRFISDVIDFKVNFPYFDLLNTPIFVMLYNTGQHLDDDTGEIPSDVQLDPWMLHLAEQFGGFKLKPNLEEFRQLLRRVSTSRQLNQDTDTGVDFHSQKYKPDDYIKILTAFGFNQLTIKLIELGPIDQVIGYNRDQWDKFFTSQNDLNKLFPGMNLKEMRKSIDAFLLRTPNPQPKLTPTKILSFYPNLIEHYRDICRSIWKYLPDLLPHTAGPYQHTPSLSRPTYKDTILSCITTYLKNTAPFPYPHLPLLPFEHMTAKSPLGLCAPFDWDASMDLCGYLITHEHPEVNSSFQWVNEEYIRYCDAWCLNQPQKLSTSGFVARPFVSPFVMPPKIESTSQYADSGTAFVKKLPSTERRYFESTSKDKSPPQNYINPDQIHINSRYIENSNWGVEEPDYFSSIRSVLGQDWVSHGKPLNLSVTYLKQEFKYTPSDPTSEPLAQISTTRNTPGLQQYLPISVSRSEYPSPAPFLGQFSAPRPQMYHPLRKSDFIIYSICLPFPKFTRWINTRAAFEWIADFIIERVPIPSILATGDGTGHAYYDQHTPSSEMSPFSLPTTKNNNINLTNKKHYLNDLQFVGHTPVYYCISLYTSGGNYVKMDDHWDEFETFCSRVYGGDLWKSTFCSFPERNDAWRYQKGLSHHATFEANKKYSQVDRRGEWAPQDCSFDEIMKQKLIAKLQQKYAVTKYEMVNDMKKTAVDYSTIGMDLRATTITTQTTTIPMQAGKPTVKKDDKKNSTRLEPSTSFDSLSTSVSKTKQTTPATTEIADSNQTVVNQTPPEDIFPAQQQDPSVAPKDHFNLEDYPFNKPLVPSQSTTPTPLQSDLDYLITALRSQWNFLLSHETAIIVRHLAQDAAKRKIAAIYRRGGGRD